MIPSEAIRIGSRDRRQCKRAFFRGNSCCAIGAIAHAIGADSSKSIVAQLEAVFPRLFHGGFAPFHEIIHMNDILGLSFEEIADRLEKMGL